MTKKEALKIPDTHFLLEGILTSQMMFQDAKDWRQAARACRVSWTAPLVTAGLIEQCGEPDPATWPDGKPSGQEQFNYYHFKLTPSGLKAWMEYRAGTASEKDVARLREKESYNFEGIGIGAELRIPTYYSDGPAAFRGILMGLFEFVSIYSYWRSPMSDSVTVKLTRAGYDFFAALPRLELECA